jgi:pyochelin biosynthetic protein PchC
MCRKEGQKSMAIPPGAWLRPLNDAPFQVLRLVCFPHSGGSAASYASWTTAVGPRVHLLAVQYPGRDDRFGEPPAAGVRERATSVAVELAQHEFLPTALFGHSLGALVAYETALALRDGGREPQCLAVSSSAPPRHAAGGRVRLADDAELWATVRGLGGIEPELVEDDELADLLLPCLRADIAANETYRPRPDAMPLSCPVRCYYGADDPLVDESRLGEWAAVSTGDFALRIRPGGHFHIFHETENLVADIMAGVTGTPDGEA